MNKNIVLKIRFCLNKKQSEKINKNFECARYV